MTEIERNQVGDKGNSEKQWQRIFTLGGVATMVAIASLMLDIAVE